MSNPRGGGGGGVGVEVGAIPNSSSGLPRDLSRAGAQWQWLRWCTKHASCQSHSTVGWKLAVQMFANKSESPYLSNKREIRALAEYLQDLRLSVVVSISPSASLWDFPV
jgi:hypothetical protein